MYIATKSGDKLQISNNKLVYRIINQNQEPIATAGACNNPIFLSWHFQTNLFLVWIYCEFRPLKESQITSTVLNFNWCQHSRKDWKEQHVHWNWPLSQEKKPTNGPWHKLSMGAACSLWWVLMSCKNLIVYQAKTYIMYWFVFIKRQ